jgi:short-subunit dehydrogenase
MQLTHRCREAGMIEVKGATVVLTGASSGVGRAAALAFARAGAQVVLAARGGEALDAAAVACRQLGAEVLVQPTDVSDPEAVERLAAAAEARFGRIDVWANIAGVGAVGAFDETPLAQHDQTLRTNLLGTLYGAYAAVRRFKRQESGLLISMNSVGAFAAAPYAVAYSASKWGVRALSLALRAELAGHPNIHVSEIYASFLDTPGVEHAANFTGAKLRPAPPVNDPDKVAAVMVGLLARPRAEVNLDAPALAIRLGAASFPRLAAWGLGRFVEAYTALAEPAPRAEGATHAAAPGPGSTHGGLKRPGLRAAVAVGALAVAASGALAARAAARSDRR